MRKNFYADAKKNELIKSYLDKYLNKYSDINYAYAVINKNNTDDIVVITDLPDYFMEVYLNNNYQNIDPVVINAMNRFSPLIWDESLMINSKWRVNTIFDSVKPYYNIISGQTFILHDADNNLAVLSLYINKYISPDVYEDVSKNKDEIQGVLIHAHEMLHHLYNSAEDKGNSVNELTLREAEILYWSSKGKTYLEIAFILNIAVSTVKFHMSKAVKKLGVQNAKHAIRLCAELNIVPDSIKT